MPMLPHTAAAAMPVPPPQQQPLLTGAEPTERDWIARAWERLRRHQPRYAQ